MMSNFDGSLKFDTAIDTSGITNGLRKISELAKKGQQALEKMTLDGLKVSGEKALEVVSKLSSVGLDALTKSIDGAVAGTTELAGSMGAVVGKSVEIGQSFESSMSQVMATMGKTKDSIASVNGQNVNIYDMLSNKAKELGASTQFSASEVADAFNYMALAGWDVEKQLSSIDGILDLSAASGLELGTTCDIVTDYLLAFGMSAEQSGQMADMMAYAQSNANLSVSNLAESWKNCAANMNANGQSIETTTALLSKMADQGEKGSTAGTKLTAIMRDLKNSAEDEAIAIGDTSVAVYDSQSQMRDLGEIMVDIQKATNGMTNEQRDLALGSSFTADSIVGVNLVLNASADNVVDFSNQLKGCGGTAEEVAKTMNDNLNGDITSMQSALEALQIALSESLNNDLRTIIQNATKYLSELRKAFLDCGWENLGKSIATILTDGIKDSKNMVSKYITLGTRVVTAITEALANIRNILLNH